MNKALIINGLMMVLSLVFLPKLTAQTLKNWEQTSINVPLPDGDYKMIYLRVNTTEGMQTLAQKIPNNAENYPMVILKEADVQPLLSVMRLYKLKAAEESVYDTKQQELQKIYEDKEKMWKQVDSIQIVRIQNLKLHNQDLTDINKALSEQVKEALRTAKDANKGRGWQGFKNGLLGGLAGLLVGLIVGLSIK